MANLQNYSDDQLVQLAKQNNLDAWLILCERYLTVVYRHVSFHVPSTDAEDITQEVFLALIKSLEGFRGDAQFKTWLWTLANRQIANYYRKHQLETVELDDEREDANNFVHPELGNVSKDDIRQVREEIIQLPQRYRDVLVLRFVHGYQFNEIARINGESLEATKSLFRRAVSALQKRFVSQNGK
jgi:RNA polymerase sigma-70 factor (ECF subfamily)